MSTRYVEVYTGSGMLDAETVKIFLESAGIKAFTSQESVGQAYGLTAGPLGESHVYVPVEQEEEAIRLLRSMENGDYIEPEDDASGSDGGMEDEPQD